jgi:cation transport ATPase
MVGDGADDAIALRVADIGVSFVENSFPFAKRLAKILINNLDDLSMIARRSRRIRWTATLLTWSRNSLIITIILGLYIWALR